jgi:hypothetical protein
MRRMWLTGTREKKNESDKESAWEEARTKRKEPVLVTGFAISDNASIRGPSGKTEG